MAVEKTFLSIQTLEDALVLLNGGQQFVLSSPSHDLADQILHQGISRIAKGKSALVTFSSEIAPATSSSVRTIIDLSESTSLHRALQICKSSLSRIPKGVTVFVRIVGTLPAVFTDESKLHDFFRSVSKIFLEKEARVIWFVQCNVFGAATVANLKDEVDFFFDVRRVGPLLVGQFLVAKGIVSPDFYLPRSLNVLAQSVTLSPMVLSPTMASPEGESNGSTLDIFEKQYKRVFDSAAEGIVLFELWQDYKEFNNRAREALGYSDVELPSLRLSDLIIEEKRFAAIRSLMLLKKKGKHSFRTEVRRKSGRTVHVEVSASHLEKNTYVAICSDISGNRTAEIQAERMRQEYHSFVSSLPYPYAIFVNRKLVDQNAAFTNLFPWTANESPSVSEFFGKKNSELLKQIGLMLEEHSAATPVSQYEVRIPGPDRTSITTEISTCVLQYKGKPALYCSFVDVSARRAVLDKAEETEKKFLSLLNQSIDAISISQDLRFTLLNRKFVEMFGYSDAMELLGKEIVGTVAGRNAKVEIVNHCVSVVEHADGMKSSFEYLGQRKNGEKIAVQMESSRIMLDGKPAVLSYHRDVTSQNEVTAEYDRKIEALGILNRFVDDLNKVSDMNDIYHRGLYAAMKGAEFEVGAILLVDLKTKELRIREQRGLPESVVSKLTAQNLDEGFARFFNKTHEPIVVHVSQYPPHLPYRPLFEAESYTFVAFLPLVTDGILHGVLLLATAKNRALDEHDRSVLASLARNLGLGIEKSQLREKNLEAEARFNSTVENISDVLYSLQPNGSFAYLSPNIETLIGYKPGDFFANANLWRTLLHPDDRPIISQRVSNQTHALNSFAIEYRLLPKGRASYIWLSDRIRYTRSASGELTSISGILTDITAQKELTALKSSEQPSKRTDSAEILKHLDVGVAVFDVSGTCTLWNVAFERLTGLASADVLGRGPADLPPSMGPIVEAVREATSEGKVSHATIFSHLAHGDTQQEFVVRASPWFDANGSLIGVITSFAETTGENRLQQSVTESEQLLRNVVDNMGDALIISDLDGQIWEVNREFTRLTGFERTEVRLTNFPYPWLLDPEMMRYIRWFAELDDKGRLHDLDMTWRHKDGHHVAVSVNTAQLTDVHGQPIAILSVARDITDRRRLLTELEWKNKQIELLNRIINFANTTLDLQQIFTSIASEIHTLVPNDGVNIMFLNQDGTLSRIYDGIPSNDGGSQKVDAIDLDERVVANAILTKRLATDSEVVRGDAVQSQASVPLFVGDSAIGVFSITSRRPNAFPEEVLLFLQAIADQISATIQRVRLFEQVTDDSSYIHNLLNSINSVVYTVDVDYRITRVNNAWHDFMARQGHDEWASEEKIIGQPLNVILNDPNLAAHYHRVMQDLFARRIDYYSRDFEIDLGKERAAYRLDISPMVINNKVTALVFIHTDITDINRTEAEVKRRNRELVALNTIGTSISKSLELAEILRVATEQLRETFDANVVAFYLFDEDQNQLVLSRTLGVSEELKEKFCFLDPAASVVGEVILQRKPRYIVDTRVGTAGHNGGNVSASFPIGLQSCAIIPLQSKENVPGAFIISFDRPHGFTENDRQLLLLISNQLSAAIQNAQLYSEIQLQVRTLTILYELGKGLTEAVDLNSMLKVVYREVSKAIPLDRFYYQSYLSEHNTLSLLSRTINGVAEFYPAGVKVRSLQDWPNRIYQEVVAQATSYMGSTSTLINDSIIAVPIKSDDKVLGIISIASETANRYNAVHLRLLESIANFTGVAIGKATLYEDTLKKSIEIENRNKELDDFTYVVSHDLKEPLISIEGYSKIVIKDYRDKLDEEGNEYLGAVIQSTTRMKHLIEDLLTLSRLGRMNEAYETVSVGKVIEEILHDFQFTLREKKVVVNVDGNLPRVRYSSTRLSMVFRNLISNAMKFNDKPSPTITIGAKEEENEDVFSVTDNGIGIEPQYFERIFTIFQRLKRSEEYRGTGAGLTIAKKIVEREGGRIWVDSIPGKGSTFYFTIRKQS